jgi:hypothetical protein
MTSNQYYGGINKRFDRRAKLLLTLGFKYTSVEGMAFFCRSDLLKNRNITASAVLYANNMVWRDKLSATLRRG